MVHKQKSIAGPSELLHYCLNSTIRSNIIECARGLSNHDTYNYTFSVHDSYCFQCRVIDSNAISAEEVQLMGPHFYTGK